MQEEARLAITHAPDVLLLSPTGSGKTLAFLLPIFESMSQGSEGVQALILAPSRELAIQIESVARAMATGYKVNVVYGGRPIKKDFADLNTTPDLLIGTPGRIGDHLRRGTFDGALIPCLVLDEYDKSLELGFDEAMSELYMYLPHLERRILTSATIGVDVPDWFYSFNPLEIDYLGEASGQLTIRRIVSSEKDKLARLADSLAYLRGKRGIIFLNYKDSIKRTSDYLNEQGIKHGVFYGGLDQYDRERSLIKFRNGSHDILLATDLAARGIDIPALDYIIHYHLPLKREEFVHRNGRTARMHQDGIAYVLHWVDDELPDFVPKSEEEEISDPATASHTAWSTILISGGRRDKISKGDIAGFCMKVGDVAKDQLGLIHLKQDCAFVAIATPVVDAAIAQLDNQRLKKRKVRVYEI
jgi:superfamily II DNA/RNA helicase